MPENFSTLSLTPTDESAKSKNCCEPKQGFLPPYLNNTEPLEAEDIPLQLALLTMEMASQREKLSSLSAMFAEMARLIMPDAFLWPGGEADG